MMMKKWEKLPPELQREEVRPYYEILRKKGLGLFCKRAFDIAVSSLMLVLLSPLFFVLAIGIKLDSPGPVFYRQVRVTQYNRPFRIFKFRSMVQNADQKGALVTVGEDSRITRTGKFIRKFRLDELPQLIDVFRGKMTFVGTRPEVPRYVEKYSGEMMATLLLPAGITSEASIQFKEEAELLKAAEDVDRVYVEEILPTKMKYNLSSLKKFSFFRDIGVMFKTVFSVFFGKSTQGQKEKEENG